MPGFTLDPDNFVPPKPSYGSPPQNPRFSSNNPFAKMQSGYVSPLPVFLIVQHRFPSYFVPKYSFYYWPLTNPVHSPGLKQELQVYSKGLDEMEWNFSRVQPPTQPGRRGSATAARPISSYGLASLDSVGKWQGNGARRSVIVGNGFGGFLAVPADGEFLSGA